MPQKHFGNTTRIGQLLERIEAGEIGAREELLREAQERLRRLAHKMLNQFPRLRDRGRVETGIVLDDVLMELVSAFDEVQFKSPKHFINLCAEKVRQTLLDLARKYKNDVMNAACGLNDADFLPAGEDRGQSISLDDWAEFHRAVAECLPDDEKSVFTLRYYGDWSREEVADILGVDVRTVTRRYGRALDRLSEVLSDGSGTHLPPAD